MNGLKDSTEPESFNHQMRKKQAELHIETP